MENKLDEKDIFEKYRDSTIGTGEGVKFFPTNSTNTLKSKYDNVIGFIKIKEDKIK